MEKFIFASIKILFWILIGKFINILLSKTNYVNPTKIYLWFSTFVVYILTPFFICIKIWQYSINKEIFIGVTTSYFVVILVSYIISKFLVNKQNLVFKEVFFTLSFMNTLYLGIPVTVYFVSPEVVNYTIIYSIIVTLIQFTLGIYLLTPSLKFFKFLVSSPIIYTAVLGYILRINGISIPEPIMLFNNFLSKIISPLMLIFIGYNFKLNNVFINIRVHIFTNITRMIILFIITTCFLILLHKFIPFQKEFIKVLILISILPSAIMNYILLDNFKFDTRFVLGEIFWGTIISIFLLPYISEILELILLALI